MRAKKILVKTWVDCSTQPSQFLQEHCSPNNVGFSLVPARNRGVVRPRYGRAESRESDLQNEGAKPERAENSSLHYQGNKKCTGWANWNKSASRARSSLNSMLARHARRMQHFATRIISRKWSNCSRGCANTCVNPYIPNSFQGLADDTRLLINFTGVFRVVFTLVTVNASVFPEKIPRSTYGDGTERVQYNQSVHGTTRPTPHPAAAYFWEKQSCLR